MSIEVRQLTVQSIIQRDEAAAKSGESIGEKKSKEDKKKEEESVGAGDACMDPEQIKAEILAACRRLIKSGLESRRVR